MKQHITAEQLDELSESAKEKLIDWLEPKNISVKYRRLLRPLSIGELIEFLDDHSSLMIIQRTEFSEKEEQWGWAIEHYNLHGDYVDDGELCDALFAAVKEVLEK